MTQQDARELLDHILLSAVKAKSNLIETLGDDEIGRMIAQETEPKLFSTPGRIDLIDAIQKYQAKARLDRQDMLNAITITRMSPATELTLLMRWNQELPSTLDIMREGGFES